MNAAEYNAVRSKLQAAIKFHERRVIVLQASLMRLQDDFKSELAARFRAPQAQPLLLEDRKYV